MMPIVILCGGLATRLYPTTKTIPKSLIRIDDIPFIYFQLDLLHDKGFKNVILCVGKFGNMIEDAIEDGEALGLRVKYSYEDENSLLGTGGAIKNALHILPDEFMITYGDSYLDVNYTNIISKFHAENKPILITIYKNKNIGDKSNVLFRNGVILNYDKKNITKNMEYIDYGLLVVKKSIFNDYTDTKFDLSLVMSDLIRKRKISSFEVYNRFYEIGSKEGIEEFKQKSLNI